MLCYDPSITTPLLIVANVAKEHKNSTTTMNITLSVSIGNIKLEIEKAKDVQVSSQKPFTFAIDDPYQGAYIIFMEQTIIGAYLNCWKTSTIR